MSYPKLFQRLDERRRPVTVYLGRDAFEGGVTRHLKRRDTPIRMNAVLHIRLSSYDSIRTHIGVAAAHKLVCNAASTLLKTSNVILAVSLGDGAFAVLVSEIRPSEAELHANFLVHSISDLRPQLGDLTLCSDAFAGLAIADEDMDGKTLLAAAEEAGLAAQEKCGGRSSVHCVAEPAVSEATERLIPSCLIAGINMDDGGRVVASLN